MCSLKYLSYCLFRIAVHTSLSREVFWHVYIKIPKHSARIYASGIILCIAKRDTENGVNGNYFVLSITNIF